jgi:predicted permease
MGTIREIRFALRSLRKSPAMTATAIGVVALGIGANAALFTVFNAVLLRPLRYPHSERIVELMRRFPGFDIWAATPTKFDFWRRQSHSFEAVSAQNYAPIGLNLTSQGEPERLLGLAVTADYFKVLGVAPAVGRTFTGAEDRPGAGHYAVLNHSLWRRLFAGKPGAIGATLRLGGTLYTVIGAMPSGFDSPQHADLWTPLALTIDPTDHANDYTVLARLKPGATLESAQGDMRATGERLRATYADLMGTRETVGVVDYHTYLVAGSREALLVLLGAVGLVLLIACANVANLLLARYTGRRHEIAVQRALGATGWTLLRQLLTESLLLAGAGAAAGLLLADSLVPLLMRLAPSALPQFATPTLDGRVILFAVLLAIATGILFTLAPAFHGARAPVADALREAGTRTTEGSGAGRLRRILVIAEVSISFVLLVGAGLLAETFQRLSRVEPGFDAQNAVTTQVSISDQRFARTQVVADMAERVASRLEALPGVVAVASTDFLPLNGLFDLPFEIVGRPVVGDDFPDEKIRTISPHYFAALRIPVLAGRVFSARDTQASAAVMLVNQAFAKKYFPKQDPLGQEILIGRTMGARFADRPRQIVGVVGDTRDLGLGSPAPPRDVRAARASARRDHGCQPHADPDELADTFERRPDGAGRSDPARDDGGFGTGDGRGDAARSGGRVFAGPGALQHGAAGYLWSAGAAAGHSGAVRSDLLLGGATHERDRDTQRIGRRTDRPAGIGSAGWHAAGGHRAGRWPGRLAVAEPLPAGDAVRSDAGGSGHPDRRGGGAGGGGGAGLAAAGAAGGQHRPGGGAAG